MKYIHYGSKRFDISRFHYVKNEPYFCKPVPGTGFWASPVNAAFGWIDWCDGEDFKHYAPDDFFTFSLTDTANVFHIRSADDIDKLPRQDNDFSMVCIDFEKVCQNGIDAIELHLSDDPSKGDYSRSLYYMLYGWDCDSILIMNPDIINPCGRENPRF